MVNHDILIAKLDHYGIRGVANDWFSSYLKNRSQFVSILGYDSSTKPVNHGVPQGSVLGPLVWFGLGPGRGRSVPNWISVQKWWWVPISTITSTPAYSMCEPQTPPPTKRVWYVSINTSNHHHSRLITVTSLERSTSIKHVLVKLTACLKCFPNLMFNTCG